MTVTELYEKLSAAIPSSLSCEWDNDGLMLCPDPEREVRRVLIALDVTSNVIRYAIEGHFDVILSHHPLIFKGVKSICAQNPHGKKLTDLARAGITVASFHTRLDKMEGGVNDVLADLLGLQNAEPFGAEGIGRIGKVEKTDAARFARRVKETLGCDAVLLADAGIPVERVALLGGAGEDEMGEAIAAGADTYLSGTLSYHDMTDAPEYRLNMVAAGHHHTEFPVCAKLREMVLAADPTVETLILNDTPLTAIV